MKHLKVAQHLGIVHETISLHALGQGAWCADTFETPRRLEEAALDHFQRSGWNGYAGEGGLILNLIKAASFDRLATRHRATFIEALYAQNVAFARDRFSIAALLERVRGCTESQIVANYRIMADGRAMTEQYRMVTSTTSTCMLDFFPGLQLDHFTGLFRALGRDRLHAIAELFARDSYEYRRGWPDLTLWRGHEVAFKEIKGPRDSLRPSQKKVIEDILKPLGLAVAIVDVTAL